MVCAVHHSQSMTPDELESRCRIFAKNVFSLCLEIRGRPGGLKAADQLQDCSSSVAANYKACRRARSRAEFIAKLGVVLEESDEVVGWLQYADDTGLAARDRVAPLLNEAMQLRAIFARSCRTARARHSRR